MNEESKILEALDKHQEHSNIFREEVKSTMGKLIERTTDQSNHIKDLANAQKEANHRTTKLEGKIVRLEETDTIVFSHLKDIQGEKKMIGDRMWTIITGLGIAVGYYLLSKILK